MANQIGDDVPGQINMGATVNFRVSFDEYQFSDGWAVKFRIASAYQFDSAEAEISWQEVEATADGASWLVTFPAGTTGLLQPGTARWQAWADKDEEKYVADSGTLEVVNDLDTRSFGSQAEQDLMMVRRALVPSKSVGVQEYEINGVGSGRRLRNYSRDDLLRLEESLAQRVNAEKRRAARAKGAPYFKTIFPR
jgi:hypothetical protein